MAVLPRDIPRDTHLFKALRLAPAVATVVVVLLIPYVLPTYRISQISGACVMALAVVGLNLLTGYGGQISLGHAAFFGLGAYTTGILIATYDVGWILAFGASVVVCFVVGVLVGMPALRVRGMYLALVTLALGVLFPSLVRRFSELTGGSLGLMGIRVDPPDIAYFGGPTANILWQYWMTMICLGLGCLVVWNLVRSRTGRAIVALRDNERAAIIMGVNRTLVRTTLFGVSAGIAGLAGALFAVQTGLLTPESFSLLVTIYFLVAMVLGGSSTYWGPILGGFAIYFIPIWSSDVTGGPISGVLFGAVVIALVFLMPSGLVGLAKSAAARFVTFSPVAPAPAEPDPSGEVAARRRELAADRVS
ncbi:branched-chain amino acid ABC transporter permease [Nocardioides humi]|uniref:Branched-chain amino acid ABC transporter permease n=1 Tax=Nocardioides humi TaxID=449461 RepID=A0ABN2BS50_9ACTN|nr:branched-chain amino acid ABC transporter permease [Nocardioides humi]